MNVLGLAILLWLTASTAATAPVASVPETPAGRTLRSYLEGLNTGDAARIAAMLDTLYMPFWFEGASAETHAGFALRHLREAGGRLTLDRVLHSEPTLIGVLLERASGGYERMQIQVEEGPRHRITTLIRGPSDEQPEVTPARDDDDLARRMHGYLEALAKQDQFSGAVRISHHRQVVLEEAWGLANRSLGKPNSAATRFRIASLGKLFTAVAIAQLASAGRLSYDAPVGRYLPDYPNVAVRERVTIGELLSHTSGIGGDPFTPRWNRSSRLLYRGDADYLPEFATDSLEFEPGTDVRYSNAGYVVLGLILERVTGTDYDTWVRAHVWAPAGMNATGVAPADSVIPDLAVGYTATREGDLALQGVRGAATGERYPNTFLLPLQGGGAGGGCSTIGDLDFFIAALTSGRLLPADEVRRLITGRALVQATERDTVRYGYGFLDERVDGVRFFGHGGTFWGAGAELQHVPDGDYTIVVLANVDGVARDVARRARALLPAR